jgi:hypothetical protein
LKTAATAPAYMRDHGASAMPVLADLEKADIIEVELGTSERRTVVTVPEGARVAAAV